MPVLLLTTGCAFLLSFVARIVAEVFLQDRIPIAGSLIGLESVENAGVAFGMALPTGIQEFFIAMAFIIVATVAYRCCTTPLYALGFGLILGGALANILDRLDDGLVSDFIQVGSFPTFNIADSCITVGVVLLIVWECWKHRMVTS